jgi:glycosyltransferase involved in cell wall biosynthesis
MARGLFVEPFYGGSHRAFADGLRACSGHEIELLTLPEGEWRRRMRRGAQELAPLAIELEGDFDFLIATDMLDLPAFLALTRRRFGDVPVLAYFHENQFTYPRLRGTKFNSWFGQINYLSACAADVVAFNSEFHRGDFLGALRALSGQPNNWLIDSQIEAIEAKSVVLPVGVDLAWMDEHRTTRDPALPPLVLWNHRWEFDKAPEVFVRAMLRLAGEGVAFRLALGGDPGPNPYPGMMDLSERLADRVEFHGFSADRRDYARMLWQSDIVVSTTRHEFFGVGMVEALYCGCFPVAPARYNYPALVPEALHARCLYETEAEFVELLRDALRQEQGAPGSLRKSAERFAWASVVPAWDAALSGLMSAGGG